MAHQADSLSLLIELSLIIFLYLLLYSCIFPLLNLSAEFSHVFERVKLCSDTYKFQELVVNLVFEVLSIIKHFELFLLLHLVLFVSLFRHVFQPHRQLGVFTLEEIESIRLCLGLFLQVFYYCRFLGQISSEFKVFLFQSFYLFDHAISVFHRCFILVDQKFEGVAARENFLTYFQLSKKS